MDTLNLTILKQNTQLYQQLQRIHQLKGLRRELNGYQATLEYINAYCLTQLLYVQTDDFNIIHIIDLYSQYNDELYKLMLSINSDYDDWSEKGFDDFDLGLFLYDIQHIYQIILTNYGDIIFDESLDFYQTYHQYIHYLENEDQCMLELKQFMNYSPRDHWYSYMEIITLIHKTFQQYIKAYSWQDQSNYIQQIRDIIGAYYEQDNSYD
ncbi:MAG: hypothetical protein LUH02_08675 [Erysipelotrichaceae bacterium]|nr:hypothetical protein [Erysipelotrichaceae bacterium]